MKIWTLKKDGASAFKMTYGPIAGIKICSESARYLVHEKHVFYEYDREEGRYIEKQAERSFPIAPEQMLVSHLRFAGVVVYTDIIDLNWKLPKRSRKIKLLKAEKIGTEDNIVVCTKTEPEENGEHEYVEYSLFINA